MRTFLFLLLLFPIPNNDPQLGKTIDRYLEKASSADQINNLVDLLGEKAYLYFDKFDLIPSINPLNPKNQKRVSSSFGTRFHPIDGRKKAHLGIDISAKAGTPIHAAASGTVKKTVYSSQGYGNQVYIDHSYGFSSRYAHMYTFIVKEGQKVKKGEIIGFVGSTGKSTGNHIHFEIQKNGKHQDPYPFMQLELPGE